MKEKQRNEKQRNEKQTMEGFQTIDDYILQFPGEVGKLLSELRSVIRAAAPDASEKISYQMPTFYYHGNLVHFAAYKNHIGFYPTPSGITAFAEELGKYKSSKGAVQFPLNQPIPFTLISKIVTFRVEENKKQSTEGKKLIAEGQ